MSAKYGFNGVLVWRERKKAGYEKQGTGNEVHEKPSITNLSPSGQTP
jgi:hypothetical protein